MYSSPRGRKQTVVALAEKLGKQGAHRVADLTPVGTSHRDRAGLRRKVGACINGLFNVAGISGRRFGDGPLHECTEEGWGCDIGRQCEKHVFGLPRYVLQQMLTQEPREDGARGAILNMASVLAFAPERKFFASHAYAASKGAIVSLSKAMASYYAPHGIRVNAIAPALVETPMSKRAGENAEIMTFMRDKQPLGAMMSATDVAGMAVFFAGGPSAGNYWNRGDRGCRLVRELTQGGTHEETMSLALTWAAPEPKAAR